MQFRKRNCAKRATLASQCSFANETAQNVPRKGCDTTSALQFRERNCVLRAFPDWCQPSDEITSPAPEPGQIIFKNRPAHQLTLGAFALAGGWSLLVWGSRIALLTGPESSNPFSWLRIGGSVALGTTFLFLAMLMWRTGSPSGWSLPTALVYLVFSIGVWIPSAVSVLAGEASIAFKAVHVVLAGCSLAVAGFAVWAARQPATYSSTTSTQMASNTSAR